MALPVVVGVVQVAAGIGSAWHHQTALSPGDWVLLFVGPLALVVRRRHPVAVLWTCFAATLTPASEWGPYVGLVVAFFYAATNGHRRAAWASIGAGFVSACWLSPLVYGHPAASAENVLLIAGWLAVLVVGAEIWRMHKESAARARAARELEDRRRASEERLRMARDLHDVIGHNISLINVQAGVGLDLMDAQPDQARASLAAIKAVSKEALDELRSMLVALRQVGDVPRAPAPGLGQLPDLLGVTRMAGLSVSLEQSGEQRPVAPAVGLAAYRIVQESLTNAVRHSGAASAVVRLSYRPDHLEVEVRDNGRGSAAPARGGGTGIAGMQERAATVGGHLEAGPLAGGGFGVTAVLPLTARLAT